MHPTEGPSESPSTSRGPVVLLCCGEDPDFPVSLPGQGPFVPLDNDILPGGLSSTSGSSSSRSVLTPEGASGGVPGWNGSGAEPRRPKVLTSFYLRTTSSGAQTPRNTPSTSFDWTSLNCPRRVSRSHSTLLRSGKREVLDVGPDQWLARRRGRLLTPLQARLGRYGLGMYHYLPTCAVILHRRRWCRVQLPDYLRVGSDRPE